MKLASEEERIAIDLKLMFRIVKVNPIPSSILASVTNNQPVVVLKALHSTFRPGTKEDEEHFRIAR